MGKPRLIIITRHAQSEGNKDKTIHQTTPDHKVPITPEGHQQARAAGEKLRALLRPDDSLHFFISPYRRTRQTTEGILSTLCSNDPDPSPFQRNRIKVYEEPRLREQDFGNFQPHAEEVDRLWRERADYGHFFYRIPNGESGADVYDRITSFNGSLWRRFSEDDMASVAVLVTHGLCSRVFLMAWYHYSVEFFEDLRNINHCEFLVMKLASNGRYVLQNQLRRWSDLRRERAALRSSSSSSNLSQMQQVSIPTIPVRRWASRKSAYDSTGSTFNARPRERKNTADMFKDEDEDDTRESDDEGPAQPQEGAGPAVKPQQAQQAQTQGETAAETSSSAETTPTISESMGDDSTGKSRKDQLREYYDLGRDGGGSHSGTASLIYSDSENEGAKSDAAPAAPAAPAPAAAAAAAAAPAKSKEKLASDDTGPSSNRKAVQTTSLHPHSLSKALRGELNGSNRAMADALGDQSDAEVEVADLEIGTKQKELSEMRQILADEKKDRHRHQDYH